MIHLPLMNGNELGLMDNETPVADYKKVRLLSVFFDDEIKPWEIPAVRGAIAQKAGEGSVLFHNHLADDSLRYSYPLIQYKSVKGKPLLLCLDDGVDEAHHFFTKKDWSINISNRTLSMKIDRMFMDNITFQVWDQNFNYRLKEWIALNQENYKLYLAIENDQEKRAFLEKKLIGNIISMAKGLEWQIGKPIALKINGGISSKSVKVKGTNTLAFNLNFQTNVFLPQYIGLGKNVAFGYGIVTKAYAKEGNDNE